MNGRNINPKFYAVIADTFKATEGTRNYSNYMHGGEFQITIKNGVVQQVQYYGTGSQWKATDNWIMNSLPRQEEVTPIEQKPIKPVEQNDEDVPMIEPAAPAPAPIVPSSASNEPAIPQSTAKTLTAPSTSNTNTGIPAAGGINYTTIVPHAPEIDTLTDRRTVLHDWVGYFSMNQLDRKLDVTNLATINQFVINLNHPYKPIDCYMNPSAAAGYNKSGASKFYIPNPGVCNFPAPAHAYFTDTEFGEQSKTGGIINENRFWRPPRFFPRTLCSDETNKDQGSPVVRCRYTEWYKKIYEYYTQLETEYTIEFTHPQQGWPNERLPIVVAIREESFVENNQTDETPTSIWTMLKNEPEAIEFLKGVSVEDMKTWKGVKFYRLTNQDYSGVGPQNKLTINYKWNPSKIKGSVKNLEDIKQWYQTGIPPNPLWTERHRVFVFADEGRGYDYKPNVNVKVMVKYTTQYKELRPNLKFNNPICLDANVVSLRIGRDDVQFPYPTVDIPKQGVTIDNENAREYASYQMNTTPLV